MKFFIKTSLWLLAIIKEKCFDDKNDFSRIKIEKLKKVNSE